MPFDDARRQQYNGATRFRVYCRCYERVECFQKQLVAFKTCECSDMTLLGLEELPSTCVMARASIERFCPLEQVTETICIVQNYQMT